MRILLVLGMGMALTGCAHIQSALDRVCTVTSLEVEGSAAGVGYNFGYDICDLIGGSEDEPEAEADQ